MDFSKPLVEEFTNISQVDRRQGEKAKKDNKWEALWLLKILPAKYRAAEILSKLAVNVT